MIDGIKYVDCIDLDDKMVQLQENSGLYYIDGEKNYTTRYEFRKVFGTLERYMMEGYEALNVNELDMQQIKDDNYDGTFVFKVVLNDSTIIKHYYTFIGYENKNIMKVAPVKMPETHRYMVDPTTILSYNWYYLESKKDMEYIEN